MAAYRLISHQTADGPRAGLVIGERVHDAATLLDDAAFATVLGILERWRDVRPILAEAAARVESGGTPLDEVVLLPPILYPPAVYCAGANYSDHVARMAEKLGIERSPDPKANGGRPYHFLKASRCCVGDGARVKAPSAALDWEGELVAVIGPPARNVQAEDALAHVAGYMIGNDLSARDMSRRPELPSTLPFSFSWIDSKSFEHAAPIGPWIVPAEDVGDPLDLQLKTWVNGVLKQDSNTSRMIFTLQEQIAYLSARITLNPGDIIFTGTPAGAGAETGDFMKPGDSVTVWIEKLGEITTHVV